MRHLLQREREARSNAEVASLHARIASEEASWVGRCDVLRQSLQKQEAHSAALEAQLASRPTALQVRRSLEYFALVPVSGMCAPCHQATNQDSAKD